MIKLPPNAIAAMRIGDMVATAGQFDYRPDLVIYHHPCNDGFGAAWAAWMRWGDEGVTYHPTTYGQPAPDVEGKHVLIVDFSYPYELLTLLSFQAASITILDHHKTAQAALERLPMFHGSIDDLGQSFAVSYTQNTPPIAAHFDMEKSGARLAWEFCHPGTELPWLIRYIEDRDLWRFTLRDTKAFSRWLNAEEMTFANWSEINDVLDGEGYNAVAVEAEAMERAYNKQVEILAEGHTFMDLIGHRVPVVNAPMLFASDVGHRLLQLNPGAPFAAVYTDRGDDRKWSLRSEDHREDVSAIARSLGGGGHRNAAGFEVAAPPHFRSL